MTPDDPRHGTYAGAVAHWKAGDRTSEVCPPCCAAGTRRRKGNKYQQNKGIPARVPRLGYVRRVHALQALGWSINAIAAEAGMTPGLLNHVVDRRADPLHRHTGREITVSTAVRIQLAYEKLSMTVPQGGYTNRVRRWAESRGWPPPLAWDNIDDPDEHPTLRQSPDDVEDYDEAVVERVLSGDWRLPSTDAERTEIARRWYASGHSLADLERLTGFKPDRYYHVGDEAA